MKKIVLAAAIITAFALSASAQTESTGIISTSVAATNGQVPTWNSTTHVWEPATAASGYNTTFDVNSGNLRLIDGGGTLTVAVTTIAPVQSLVAGTGISVSNASGAWTVTNTSPDQTVALTGAGITAITGTYPNFTITSTEVDGLLTNEGSLTVAAGAATTSIINSNTSGQTGVTLTAGNGLDISESGNVITHKLSNTGLNVFTGATSDQANANCTDAVGTPFIWNTGSSRVLLFKI